jgi:chaperonin GroES
MSQTLQPLADYVVAQPEEANARTASGFYVPESAKEKPKTAQVIAVGSAVKEVKAGDRIVYKSYAPTEVKVDGSEYILLKQEDVMATVKGK